MCGSGAANLAASSTPTAPTTPGGQPRTGIPLGSTEISNLGVKIYEEVLSFDRPRRMTYRIVRGAVPIRDHRGEVVFDARGGGTLVTWRCQFDSRIPGLGGATRAVLTRVFRNVLHGLARRLG